MEISNQAKFTVFCQDAAIHLLEKEAADHPDAIFVDNRSGLYHKLDHFLASAQEEDLFLCTAHFGQLLEDFKSYFRFVPAAGGLVQHMNGQFLLIKRFGIWDLPKGKVEDHESSAECALREVSEETNVQGISIKNQLPSTCHIYPVEEQYILKETYWFLMQTTHSGNLKPQQKEDITEAVWMNRNDALNALKTSYRSIRDILVPFISN